MTIRAVHSTVYRYDAPVFIEPHMFRLCPRADAAQRLAEILAPVGGNQDDLPRGRQLAKRAMIVGFPVALRHFQQGVDDGIARHPDHAFGDAFAP